MRSGHAKSCVDISLGLSTETTRSLYLQLADPPRAKRNDELRCFTKWIPQCDVTFRPPVLRTQAARRSVHCSSSARCGAHSRRAARGRADPATELCAVCHSHAKLPITM